MRVLGLGVQGLRLVRFVREQASASTQSSSMAAIMSDTLLYLYIYPEVLLAFQAGSAHSTNFFEANLPFKVVWHPLLPLFHNLNLAF